MDTNDKNEVLRKYLRHPYPTLGKPVANQPSEPDEETEEPGYRALIEHREKKGSAPRFRIVDRKGVSYGCGYAYLIGWYYAPPDTLTLYTTSAHFVLSGRHLQPIENALMRERVKQLREFNPDHDLAPPAGETLIESLEVTIR